MYPEEAARLGKKRGREAGDSGERGACARGLSLHCGALRALRRCPAAPSSGSVRWWKRRFERPWLGRRDRRLKLPALAAPEKTFGMLRAGEKAGYGEGIREAPWSMLARVHVTEKIWKRNSNCARKSNVINLSILPKMVRVYVMRFPVYADWTGNTS